MRMSRSMTLIYHTVTATLIKTADRYLKMPGARNNQAGLRHFANECGESPTAAIPRKQTTSVLRDVPCVDGSELAREIFTSQGWSVQPCVRPVSAAHGAAGHNALRGSGPGQKPAFDNALAHVGCPDRRIDRLCITCCSPSQLSHHAGCRRDLVYAASATGSSASGSSAAPSSWSRRTACLPS